MAAAPGRQWCDQLPVLDAVRLVGLGAEPRVPVRLVVLVVALEPHDLAVALEGQDVRGDAVEEPAVVADDHRAAGEVEQRRPRAPAGCRRRGRWSARRAAARCRRCLSSLARCTRLRSPPERSPRASAGRAPLKLNEADVGARVHRALAERQIWSAPPVISSQTVLLGVERVAALVDVGELHGLAERSVPASGFSWPMIMRKAWSCRRRSGRSRRRCRRAAA